jgi:hypothetical protein
MGKGKAGARSDGSCMTARGNEERDHIATAWMEIERMAVICNLSCLVLH